MKKILLVSPNGLGVESKKELLESTDREVFIAKSEEEVIRIVKNEEITVMLLEPLLSANFLIDDNQPIKNIEIGGVGLILFKKIHKAFPDIRIILLTVVSQKNTLKAGFPENLFHLRSPMRSEDILEVIG